jgi:hypothetical protein
MALRYCRMCTAQYAVGSPTCPQCGRQDEDNLFDYEVNPPADNVAKQDEAVDEAMRQDLKEEGEQVSAGNNSSTSPNETDEKSNTNSASPSSPAPTTEPHSSTPTESAAAPSTAGNTQETTTQQSTAVSDQ